MNSALTTLAENPPDSGDVGHVPIDVFRVGSFTDMGGGKHAITLKDLQAIADSYDAENHPAPVVIGHPAIDAPAYGWIDRFWIEGEVLKATIREAAPEFVEIVKEGRYKRVSIALFPPNASENPVPGALYARHVGFLGAAAPAVPGLKPVKFAGDFASCFAISQEVAAPLSAEQIELKELRRASLDRQVEDLVDQGRVLPVFKEEVLSFAAHLGSTDSINFANGSQLPARDWFFDYLAKQPVMVSFGAMDLPAGPGTDDTHAPLNGVSIPDGYTVDPTQGELAARAHRVSREHSVSFAAALDLIQNGEA